MNIIASDEETYPITFQRSGTVLLTLAKTVATFTFIEDVCRKLSTISRSCSHYWKIFNFSKSYT